MRVSLSDWPAFQARIRGSKDPRLLRDRPTDGAASVCKNSCGFEKVLYADCGGSGWFCGGINACRSARVSLSDWLALVGKQPRV